MIKVADGVFPRASFIQTRISHDEWYVTVLIDDKQIVTRHKKISDDGKILRQIIRRLDRLDDEGQPSEVLLILERQ